MLPGLPSCCRATCDAHRSVMETHPANCEFARLCRLLAKHPQRLGQACDVLVHLGAHEVVGLRVRLVLYRRYLLEEVREVLAYACEGLGTRKRFVCALSDVGGGEDFRERRDGLSAQLQQEFSHVVDGGKQPVVEFLKLGVRLEEVASGYVPVLVLELVVLDGELDEGSNWEGLMTIRHYNLTNCITIVDRNHCMIDGNTEDVMKLEPLADKFVAFGFHTIVCEGNNIVSLCKAIDEAHKTKDKPTVIVADTIKGVGIKLTSGNYKWHYGAIDEEMAKVAAKDLDEYSAERIARCGKEFE